MVVMHSTQYKLSHIFQFLDTESKQYIQQTKYQTDRIVCSTRFFLNYNCQHTSKLHPVQTYVFKLIEHIYQVQIVCIFRMFMYYMCGCKVLCSVRIHISRYIGDDDCVRDGGGLGAAGTLSVHARTRASHKRSSARKLVCVCVCVSVGLCPGPARCEWKWDKTSQHNRAGSGWVCARMFGVHASLDASSWTDDDEFTWGCLWAATAAAAGARMNDIHQHSFEQLASTYTYNNRRCEHASRRVRTQTRIETIYVRK